MSEKDCLACRQIRVFFFFFEPGTILSDLSPCNQIAPGCHMRFSNLEDEMARLIVRPVSGMFWPLSAFPIMSSVFPGHCSGPGRALARSLLAQW